MEWFIWVLFGAKWDYNQSGGVHQAIEHVDLELRRETEDLARDSTKYLAE